MSQCALVLHVSVGHLARSVLPRPLLCLEERVVTAEGLYISSSSLILIFMILLFFRTQIWKCGGAVWSNCSISCSLCQVPIPNSCQLSLSEIGRCIQGGVSYFICDFSCSKNPYLCAWLDRKIQPLLGPDCRVWHFSPRSLVRQRGTSQVLMGKSC